jgi:hypothetical protein
VAGTPSPPGAGGFAPPVSPPAATCFLSVEDGFGVGFLLAEGFAEGDCDGDGAIDEGGGDGGASTLGAAAAPSDLPGLPPHAVSPSVTTNASANPTRVPSTRAA